jgi:2-dehydro-3-deoxyglucarate aldolase
LIISDNIKHMITNSPIPSNKISQALKENRVCLGGWTLSGSVVIAEILAQAGFEWVCIDAEHSPVSKETAMNMIIAIQRHGAEPIVRIGLNFEMEFKKFLDAGARGILVPMVKSAADVEKAISFTRYAPAGNRSFALPRATGYGKYPEHYFRHANQSILLIIMIEHIQAVHNLDAILEFEQLDAIFVGPYDLSGSMGKPGQFDDREFKEAMKLISIKASEHNMPTGIHEVHPTREKISEHISNGFKLIACGLDTLFVLESAEKFSNILS